MSNSHNEKELDFEITKENWTRYKLDDGTVLKVRVAVLKVFDQGLGELGYPNIRLGSVNLLVTTVPSSLKKPPPIEPQRLEPEDVKKGRELSFKRVSEEVWQDYALLGTDWILQVRPEISKVIVTSKFNSEGEPIYWANIDPVLNVTKAARNRSDSSP